MIVDEIYVVRIAVTEAKDDAPIARHGDRPEALKTALERMQSKGGQRHVLDIRSLIQPSQDSFDIQIGRRPSVPEKRILRLLKSKFQWSRTNAVVIPHISDAK